MIQHGAAGNRGSALCAVLLVCLGLSMSGPVNGYEGSQHQYLTFLAAKQFNACVTGTDIPLLTPLQVRYMARTNVGLADRTLFARMFNWRYYDPADQAEHTAVWMIDTRFHEHFNEISARLETEDDPADAYQEVGRILNYVQLVSSPPRAVPVYTGRFWRFSFEDRFDSYPIDEDALEEALGADCSFLESNPGEYSKVLGAVAMDTLRSVQESIPGMPINWTSYWSPSDEPGSFGDYGPAGNNFGRKTDFRCGDGQRCVLLKDDPLYADFALSRHLQAVKGSMAVMQLMQMGVRDTVASAQ